MLYLAFLLCLRKQYYTQAVKYNIISFFERMFSEKHEQETTLKRKNSFLGYIG
jgi:hypothetical protein